MNTKQDLETLTREAIKEIRDIHSGIPITENLSMGDLKKILEMQLCFIDYCKFEFGEGITEGK